MSVPLCYLVLFAVCKLHVYSSIIPKLGQNSCLQKREIPSEKLWYRNDIPLEVCPAREVKIVPQIISRTYESPDELHQDFGDESLGNFYKNYVTIPRRYSIDWTPRHEAGILGDYVNSNYENEYLLNIKNMEEVMSKPKREPVQVFFNFDTPKQARSVPLDPVDSNEYLLNVKNYEDVNNTPTREDSQQFLNLETPKRVRSASVDSEDSSRANEYLMNVKNFEEEVNKPAHDMSQAYLNLHDAATVRVEETNAHLKPSFTKHNFAVESTYADNLKGGEDEFIEDADSGFPVPHHEPPVLGNAKTFEHEKQVYSAQEDAVSVIQQETQMMEDRVFSQQHLQIPTESDGTNGSAEYVPIKHKRQYSLAREESSSSLESDNTVKSNEQNSITSDDFRTNFIEIPSEKSHELNPYTETDQTKLGETSLITEFPSAHNSVYEDVDQINEPMMDIAGEPTSNIVSNNNTDTKIHVDDMTFLNITQSLNKRIQELVSDMLEAIDMYGDKNMYKPIRAMLLNFTNTRDMPEPQSNAIDISHLSEDIV